MKIAVVGATGHTGRLVVEQALARGDDVVALARRPEGLPRHPGIVSVAADVIDRAALAEPLAGTDSPIPLARDVPRNADQGGAAGRRVVAVYVELDVVIRVGAKRMRCIVYRIARDVPLEREK